MKCTHACALQPPPKPCRILRACIRPHWRDIEHSDSILSSLLLTCFWSSAGPFSGVAHVAALLDHTPRRGLRHTLLRLLHSLLVPEAATRGDDLAAAPAARANGIAFMACGGIELLVDLLTCASLHPVALILFVSTIWMKLVDSYAISCSEMR